MKPLYYYPSVVVGLRIQFDESLTAVNTPPAEEANRDPSSERPRPEENPLFGGADDLTFVSNIVPKTASVELPAQRQAGKFSLELDWRTLPIDPRAIRAVGVSIYAGLVDPGAFASNMARPNGTAMLDWTKDGKPNRDKLLLMGSVDSLSMEHGGSGSTLTLEGRDLRAVFIDAPFPTNFIQRIDASQPIDDVVRQVLDVHALQSRGSSKVVVLCDAQDFPGNKIPSPYSEDDSTRVQAPAKAGSGKGRAKGTNGTPAKQNELSYWDLIINYCQRVGAIAWFEGPDIRIRHGSSLFEQADRRLAEGKTPFAGGAPRTVTLGNGKTVSFNFRQLVFGSDVESFSFEHKLTGRKETIVEVRSYNSDGDQRGLSKMLVWRYPRQTGVPSKKQAKAQATTGGSSKENVLVVSKPGLKNIDQLALVAKSIYEEVMRGEMNGTIKTRDLTSFGGSSSDPDLLKLRPGDAFQLSVDNTRLTAAPQVTPALTALAQLAGSGGTPEKDLVARGLSPRLAKLLVATSSGKVPALAPYFYCNTVKYDWDIAKGLSISFDFSNYVVARNPPVQDLGEQAIMVKEGDQPAVIDLGEVVITAGAPIDLGEVVIIAGAPIE